jgi:surface antigen
VNNLIASAVGLIVLSSSAAFAQYDSRDSQYNPPRQFQEQRQNDSRRDDAQRSGGRYEDGFRDGYRSGYDAGRGNQRYDDRYSAAGGSGDDQQARWRKRYAKTYTYTDDSYYQQCRNAPDPAGVIAGALIGGLLGNAVGNNGGRAGTTVAGVIIGGAVGASLTKNLDCEDRGFAYKTYYDGFNSGRPNTRYQWYNGRNDHNGELQVRDYYNDADGFRCANFNQVIYVYGRPQETRGRACKQPDGTWAIVG